MAKSYEDAFYDASYAAWRRGLNPDCVDRDAIGYYASCGYDPDECVSLELQRVTPKQAEEDSQHE